MTAIEPIQGDLGYKVMEAYIAEIEEQMRQGLLISQAALEGPSTYGSSLRHELYRAWSVREEIKKILAHR